MRAVDSDSRGGHWAPFRNVDTFSWPCRPETGIHPLRRVLRSGANGEATGIQRIGRRASCSAMHWIFSANVSVSRAAWLWLDIGNNEHLKFRGNG